MSDLSAAEARELIEEIKTDLEQIPPKISALYEGQGWLALGYESWTDLLMDVAVQARARLAADE